jgi:hypothetical protein
MKQRGREGRKDEDKDEVAGGHFKDVVPTYKEVIKPPGNWARSRTRICIRRRKEGRGKKMRSF